ncbi:hypothetical protein [Helicobacter sp. MIT 14-3879]|uniref:hypothetical protein n=1 Tax=Helicobacter sp. MIT 14-3879 TaxID=2040649 RepID=UPI000E1FB34D|nr:hypothetical protein [Helicobacter sp. MIT 14-3879]RDU65641.1 hypothetical protein CQA44_01280 [Helicobacter sp. MIT 14-3879]
MQSNKQRLIEQLKNHGLENLNNLSEEALLEQFKKTTMQWSKSIAEYNLGIKKIQNTSLEIIDSKIKAKIEQTDNFYSTFNELLVKYPYNNIHDVVVNFISADLVEKVLLILEIKYREYQEIIIEMIEKKINFMPKEEIASFMSFIERNRNEVELLKDILNQLENNKISSNIDKITNIKKYIISEFMPQDLEKNYKQFFNNSQDKQDLIKRLREISSAYSTKQLDDMTKEDLVDILTSIQQKEVNDKKDKDDFEKYFELFKRALYEDNNDLFDSLVVQVLGSVSKECLNNLKIHLKKEDALFEHKFQNAQKSLE